MGHVVSSGRLEQCAARGRGNSRGRRGASSIHTLKFEFDFVDVAPAPIFAGFDGFHDGVVGCVEMFCGVFIFGGIAAGNVAADHAEAEMNPGVAQFDAFGADVSVSFNAFFDLIQVRACWHVVAS
jgi:hypothetical protein